MLKYMRQHNDRLREQLKYAEKCHRWAECLRLEVRILESDNLYCEMLKRVKNGFISWDSD